MSTAASPRDDQRDSTRGQHGDTHRIVLASTSPSRLSILRSAGVEPVLINPEVDEDAAAAELQEPTPEEFVQHLAQAKARAAWRRRQEGGEAAEGDVLIGGDSMLLIDGQLQGKPHTEEETVRRWQQQRGKTARLITGHCVIYQGDEYLETATTTLHFANATDADIRAYAATGEPLFCAGAFTLEALGGWFIDRIEGDPSSVIGLSLPTIRRALESFGLTASSFWNAVPKN